MKNRKANIKRSHMHDAGAYGRCSYCGRYSDNPNILSHKTPCDCGKIKGWCGSFKKPVKESKWSEWQRKGNYMSLDVSLYIKVDTGGAEKKKIVLFDANITHNLADMADAAGIYKYLWRPEEIGAKCAGDIIEAAEKGLALMKSDPERFKEHNPTNGWGTYDGFIVWVEEYLGACKDNPKATIYVSK